MDDSGLDTLGQTIVSALKGAASGHAVAFGHLGVAGFWSMMVFLAVLTVGFIYEWKKGALEWD